MHGWGRLGRHYVVSVVERADGEMASTRPADTVAQPAPTFDDLYATQFLPMVRLATLMSGRVEVARDVVQDAFVGLHVRWAHVGQPAAYLRRSVVNGCRSVARWERRRSGRPVDDEPWADADTLELLDVLSTLPHRQRAALVLRYYEGRTEAEIAELLGCRPGSVGPLITRGIQALRTQLTITEGER